jgi:hypothetical protein
LGDGVAVAAFREGVPVASLGDEGSGIEAAFGCDEFADIGEDESNAAAAAELLIDGLGGAIDGDDHGVEAGFDVRIGVEFADGEAGGEGRVEEVVFGKANELGCLEIVVAETGADGVRAVELKERGEARLLERAVGPIEDFESFVAGGVDAAGAGEEMGGAGAEVVASEGKAV